MGRVGRALILHELLERTRDRWVVVISLLFALLSSAVSLYGRAADGTASQLTGPSLVTLASLLIPLVALVLGHDALVGERERNTLGLLLSLPVSRVEVVIAKFIGRLLALLCSIFLGLGAAVLVAPAGHGRILAQLALPSSLLGAAFLALGVLISATARRQVTAASLVVVVWFSMVFFYDLGLLGLLVVTDGGVSAPTVGWLVAINPAGLYRVEMLARFSGSGALDHLGVQAGVPRLFAQIGIWAGWILVPLGLSGILLTWEREMR